MSQPVDSPWPTTGEARVLFWLDVRYRVELTTLREWLDDTLPHSPRLEWRLAVPSGRNLELDGERFISQSDVGELSQNPSNDPEWCVVPLRVVWIGPPNHSGGPKLRDLLMGDPRSPSQLHARWIASRHPERMTPIAGMSAPLGELTRRYAVEVDMSDSGDDNGLSGFVGRQAELALDVAERRLQGRRYKVPRYVAEGLRGDPTLNREVEALAKAQQRAPSELWDEAEQYFGELVATPSTFFIDWMGKVSRFMASLGYREPIECDPENVAQARRWVRDYPSALLWTHKSHVDGVALMSVMYENDFPLAHSMGGINMAFAGVGYLGRKAGVIYIRRTFQDNALYKLVFRHYLGYLMAKRFPFSWAFEGTRSRVGKLMPPRYGLLKYVLEAAKATGAEDLHLIPVCISYDLIGEAAEYASEQAGQSKQAESLGWFLGYLRRLRAPKGRIYLTFCEPVVCSGKVESTDQEALSRIAFDIATRVNAVTPVTLPALMCIALLGAAPRALTFTELDRALRQLFHWVEHRGVRMTGNLRSQSVRQLRELAQLVIDRGVIASDTDGPETLFYVAPNGYSVASYYRNTVIHYFVEQAMLELALVGSDSQSAVWEKIWRLRDLFKFEFFYPAKPEFQRRVEAELSRVDPDWADTLDQGGGAKVLAGMEAHVAHATLLPYLEAYSILVQVLAQASAGTELDENESVSKSLSLGRQAVLNQRVSNEASVGKALFQNAYKLVNHLGLGGVADANLVAGRRRLAAEFNEFASGARKIRDLSLERLETT